jgi:hypothetical protein
MDTDENNDGGETSSENNTLEIDSSVSATSEFDIFVATAPVCIHLLFLLKKIIGKITHV